MEGDDVYCGRRYTITVAQSVFPQLWLPGQTTAVLEYLNCDALNFELSPASAWLNNISLIYTERLGWQVKRFSACSFLTTAIRFLSIYSYMELEKKHSIAQENIIFFKPAEGTTFPGKRKCGAHMHSGKKTSCSVCQRKAARFWSKYTLHRSTCSGSPVAYFETKNFGQI